MVSLNLQILSKLHRRYEPSASFELNVNNYSMLVFTDDRGYPMRVLVYLAGKSAESGYWMTRKGIAQAADDIIKYVWEKEAR